MNGKENKAMRCMSSVLLTVVLVVVAFGIGYRNWNDTAFEAQTKKHSPLESVSYEAFMTERWGATFYRAESKRLFVFVADAHREHFFR